MRVAIVGAGIGGLTAALFLRRAGIEAAVYEQAPVFGTVGAGIQLGPNAVRLLHRVGLARRLSADGVRPSVAWEIRRWESGAVLFQQALDGADAAMFGAPYYLMHRADLLDGLLELMPARLLHPGHRCTGIAERADGVELVFENDRSVVVDLVVGADGIHSLIRERMFGTSTPRFSGLCQYRALVPIERTPLLGKPASSTLWLGPGRHLVHYPVANRTMLNIVGHVPAGNWRTESWSARGQAEEFAAEFAGWHAQVTTIIAAVEETKRWALYDRPPLDRWTTGRVGLVGDAAHPMLPFLAQGACQAIEDAAALAGCLRGADRDTIAAALDRYERLRKPRATKVQLMSRGRAAEYHLADGAEQRARDERLASSDPLRANAWLYDYDIERELDTVPTTQQEDWR
jgi:salicylate hydroxylase